MNNVPLVHVYYNTCICDLKQIFGQKSPCLSSIATYFITILFQRVITSNVKSDNSFDLKVMKTFKYTGRLFMLACKVRYLWKIIPIEFYCSLYTDRTSPVHVKHCRGMQNTGTASSLFVSSKDAVGYICAYFVD